MAEISPANRSIKLNNRILNRINETVNGSQSQLQSLLTSAANAVSSIISSTSSSSSLSNNAAANNTSSHLVINSGPLMPTSSSSSSASSGASSSQHTPNELRQQIVTASTLTTTENMVSLPSNWSYNQSITSSVKLDKKMFDKVNKLADKLLKYCQSEHMHLINSPPYIIDILPDICQIFNTVAFVYENKMTQLNEIDYFCVLMRNTLEKFQELVDLFKSAGKRMYEETSVERQKLVKYTLTYSHMLAEMKCMFPKDIYEGETFRIAKKDAADFWKANFGEKVIVGWREFELKLNRVHQISNQLELNSLRETIQLTKTKYVTIFEFDIFTRLFQPWNNLLNNWKFLVTEHPGYCAFSTYDEIHKRLQKHINKPGSYLFRLSCTKLGQWAIGYVTQDHKILQTIPQSLIQALIDGQKQGLYVYPDGRDIKIDISSAIAIMSASRIQCSREQYEMYCDMGTSFQVCKICSENNKDRKLEPCGHLICSTCLENWQELHAQPSCPFCRCEIKTFEPVVISPFESAATASNRERTSSLLSDDSGGSAGGKSELLSNGKKSGEKLSKEECKLEKTRSESMRLESKPTTSRSVLTEKTTTTTSTAATKHDNLSASYLQTMSLNSLNQSLSSANNINGNKYLDDDDDYLKPSRPTSSSLSGPNSLQNSTLHLKSDDCVSSAGIMAASALVDKNSSIESSASSSSIDNPQTKYNVDLILSANMSSSAVQQRETLLPPPPPPPVASTRSHGTPSSSKASTATNNGISTTPTTTGASKTPLIPGLPTPKPILTPPSLPPPPLPPPLTATNTPPTLIISSDSLINGHVVKSSTVRLRVENEMAFEQAMSQLHLASSDRVRAACALFLAGNDLKLAKSILNTSLNNN